MATKKQKRQALMEKRERFEEELRQTGLEALRKDREHREMMERRAWQDQHDKKHSWQKLIVECPHCQDVRKAQRRSQTQDQEAS